MGLEQNFLNVCTHFKKNSTVRLNSWCCLELKMSQIFELRRCKYLVLKYILEFFGNLI